MAFGRRSAVLWGHGDDPEYSGFGAPRPRIPEEEIAERLRTELAIALYAQGALSLGKAAELAETNRMNFGEMVGERGIARHYGDARRLLCS